ncbi:endolytic transglycosylase MltG [Streptomyces sp. TRM66268-LWL]|uniref:Endolytic murein transglycosylase n=1 Tax=Streptomyces polyasparticus TaxID=2767826 RepID=A0ABR7SS48_9ACTN|nr:endolytic transglycosylase MltG [Streptomyces polyasparticus]MBC9717490.1 endolytic transglycosylase MltG [Streptomyces polyasparticus]
MRNDSAHQGRIRLTRRGKVALGITGALLAGAAAGVPVLLDRQQQQPSQAKTLLVPEGWRTSQVYDAIDKALEAAPGTARKSAHTIGLKLPGEAAGNPEGYLFPATYPIGEDATPASLLAYMVDTANRRFGGQQVKSAAEDKAVSVYQAVTIASIAQAEAETKQDMGKVARVVYNRMNLGMPLQMDSTINYAMNRSTVDTSTADTRISSPYNTYARMGLPPTPIANPGDDALAAALNPPQGDWLYFVTVRPGDTRFTADYAEHQRNVEEFNAARQAEKQAQAKNGSASVS